MVLQRRGGSSIRLGGQVHHGCNQRLLADLLATAVAPLLSCRPALRQLLCWLLLGIWGAEFLSCKAVFNGTAASTVDGCRCPSSSTIYGSPLAADTVTASVYGCYTTVLQGKQSICTLSHAAATFAF